MKKLTLVAAVFLVYFSSCTTGQYTASREYDDVYYSSQDKAADESRSQQQPANSNTGREEIGNDENRFNYDSEEQKPDYTSTEEKDGNTYVTNNYYYDEDDYYDYAYSSRIRRFYHPYGWSYYDSYYTNSYWYDYNPYSWGISIYLGYNWWHPHHTWGFGFGYGYPYYAYSNPWYDPWYSPYGYWGYNHGYYHGYQNGYIDGYYAGLYNGTFNPYYFNSYDSYSYYYGPRNKGSALNTPSSAPVSQLYAENVIGDRGGDVRSNTASAIQPFSTPKHYSQQPVRDVRDVKTNVPVKDSKDVRDIKDVKDVRDTKDVPVRDTKQPVRDVKQPGRDDEQPVRDIKQPTKDTQQPVRDTKDVPVKDNRGDVKTPAPKDYTVPSKGNEPVKTPRSTESPVKNQHNPAPVYTPRNDEPVKNPPVIREPERNNELHQSPEKKPRKSSIKREERKPDIKLPAQDGKNVQRSHQQVNQGSEQQQSPSWNQPRQDSRSSGGNSNNSNSNSNGRPRR